MMRARLAAPLVAAAALFLPSNAGAATVVNGDFDGPFGTGSLLGWTWDDTGSGSWFAYSGTTTPATSTPVSAPPQGSFAAVTDQTFSGSHILYQDIELEPNLAHTLSLFVYYRSNAPIASPDTLDHSGPPPANQQYRIDVVRPGAPIRSLSPNDVLLNVFRTNPGDPQTLAPTPITADLTQFAGQTIRLRFAEVDNQNVFKASTDAVEITSSDVTAPTATITKGPKDKTRKKSATFEFTGTDARAIARFECSVDGRAFVSCASPFTVKVKKGKHTFAVRAVDQSGNAGSAASDTWKRKKRKRRK